MALGEIVVTGEEALKVADALTSTSLKILQLISGKRLDISTIANKLGLSEPYISEQVRTLEKSKLIKVGYEPGRRGIRKLCELAIERVIIIIKPQAQLAEHVRQEHIGTEMSALIKKREKQRKRRARNTSNS